MPTNLTEHVVRTVDHQTGGPQRDRVPWHTLLTILSSHGGRDADAVWDALEDAVNEGRLGYDEDEREFWIPE